MKIIVIFSLLATIITVSQAGADFYRYLDRHGNVIYTDDLNQVPADQRSKTEAYPDKDQIVPFESDGAGSNAIKPDQEDHQKKDLERDRDKLDVTKAKLEQEFRSLVKENAGLKKEQESAVTTEQIKAINRKAVDFNTRFRAYQEKKAAYDAQIKALNK